MLFHVVGVCEEEDLYDVDPPIADTNVSPHVEDVPTPPEDVPTPPEDIPPPPADAPSDSEAAETPETEKEEL